MLDLDLACDSPLLGVKSFQKHVLGRLGSDYRTGRDQAAAAVSQAFGVPAYSADWPVDKRDEAANQIAQHVEQYGDAYKWRHDPLAWTEGRLPTLGRLPHEIVEPKLSLEADFHLDPLGRPATEDDVAQGKAIFTVNEASARVIPLEKYPSAVLWRRPGSDQPIEAEAWQAEEYYEGTEARRFFGLATQDGLFKVPASEVEFSFGERWVPLSDGLTCQIGQPAQLQHDAAITPDSSIVARGLPVLISLWIRNASGADQRVPVSFIDRSNARRPRLHRGVTISLKHVPAPLAADYLGRPLSTDESAMLDRVAHWYTQQAKFESSYTPDAERLALKPGDVVQLARLDLGRWFDLSAAGTYRIQVSFSKDDGCFTDGSVYETAFVVKR